MDEDKVVDVDREAVQIIEEVVGCRADVDAKCGGIKGRAVCGATEAGVLEGLVGDVEEELLLHVHARTLVLADTKVRLVEGWHVVEEVPVEGCVHVGGDHEHHGKVVGVKPVQETQVRREAGIMRLTSVSQRAGRPSVPLSACWPTPMTAMGSNVAVPSERSGLGLSARVGDVGRGPWVGGASLWVCVGTSVGSSAWEQVGESMGGKREDRMETRQVGEWRGWVGGWLGV